MTSHRQVHQVREEAAQENETTSVFEAKESQRERGIAPWSLVCASRRTASQAPRSCVIQLVGPAAVGGRVRFGAGSTAARKTKDQRPEATGLPSFESTSSCGSIQFMVAALVRSPGLPNHSVRLPQRLCLKGYIWLLDDNLFNLQCYFLGD